MIRKDYHQYRLAEALTDADRVVSDMRMQRKSDTAEFITGYGVIRTELFDLLKGLGLNPSYKLGNAGTIVCEIE